MMVPRLSEVKKVLASFSKPCEVSGFWGTPRQHFLLREILLKMTCDPVCVFSPNANVSLFLWGPLWTDTTFEGPVPFSQPNPLVHGHILLLGSSGSVGKHLDETR